jgi:hypothetical protein
MSQEPIIPLRWRQLFDAVCEGIVSAAEVAELQAILQSDEQARRLYRDYCRLHVDLHFVVRGCRATGAVGDVIHQGRRTPLLGFLGDLGPRSGGILSSYSLVFSLLGLVAVVGSLAAAVGWALHGRQPEQAVAAAAPAARLTRAIDCRWNGPEVGFSPGAELVAGRELELAAGEAEIAFRSGARIVVRGPSILKIESENSARLLVGRVTARADTKRSHGFILHTQTASVLDLGTEFHVQAAADGHAEIHVTAGTVEIQTVKHQARHRLQVGDTAQVEPGDAGVYAVIESGSGTSAFTFPTIAPPSNKDYADATQHHATIRVAEGTLHGESGPIPRLLDGKGQSTADSPGESVFFANNQKGKILLDLGKAVRVRKVDTYSWHAYEKVSAGHDRYDTRATQRYNLYGYVGERPPATAGDPAAHGWILISRVNTDDFFSVPPAVNRPTQQAVSITAADGNVGRYRFLLWDVHPTHVSPYPPYPEGEQNTFFGEFDVFAEDGP